MITQEKTKYKIYKLPRCMLVCWLWEYNHKGGRFVSKNTISESLSQ